MNVLFDHQIFTWQKFGGISRVFCELIANSDGLFGVKTGGIFSENEYLKKIPHQSFREFPVKRNFRGKGRIISTANRNDSLKKLSERDTDIFHPTYYNPYFLERLGEKKLVVSVWDMIHEEFPNICNDGGETTRQKMEVLNRADGIIAISRSTKNDLLKFFPQLDSEKISVVYLGNSFPVSAPAEKKGRYILFTGGRGGYKNFEIFVKSVAPLLKKYDLDLVFTGREFSLSERKFFEALGILERTKQKYATDEELRVLYNEALLFVFPSLYEGFGIPVLEAFSSGCPLAVSRSSSLTEIAGEAGYFFDPYSEDEMRRKIEDIIVSPSLQKSLAEKGYERLKEFSWRKCAEETAKVYEQVLK